MARKLSDLLGMEVYVDVSIDRKTKTCEFIIEIPGEYCSVCDDDTDCYNELFTMVNAIRLYKKIKEGK
ncbi:MAG: hypothetical protein J6W09_04490 [Bacteroidales bacterium]|nr:hypothetical protein [Bacteroidales bacterium]